MKVTKLYAENVHGYLPINIDFFEDITFLTGLNGSGKTSALRLLMALLTPNIKELSSIAFSQAEVTIFDNEQSIVIKANKNLERVDLQISIVGESLLISSSELELFIDTKRDEEPLALLQDKYLSNPVFQAIRKISTPMFLGLDRRFFVPGTMADDIDETRRREYMARRYWSDDSTVRSVAPAASLIEVNYLVVTRMQEIRVKQEQLDEKLRGQFFAKAFEYKPSGLRNHSGTTPSREEINQYRKQLEKIEKAGEGLKIPVPEIQTAMTHFIEKMSRVVDSLEKKNPILPPQNLPKKNKKDPRNNPPKSKEPNIFPEIDYLEWIINKPQADRILEHLQLLNEYIEKRDSLRDPINRFLLLVNSFLSQTKKEVAVTNTGQLTVSVIGNSEARHISALSSGERQLLVMLAHLSLNPNLDGSGIFIVDEPELSLHIDWQEKFVDAIREANPKVQLILATHSPAIILDRIESCISLS